MTSLNTVSCLLPFLVMLLFMFVTGTVINQ